MRFRAIAILTSVVKLTGYGMAIRPRTGWVHDGYQIGEQILAIALIGSGGAHSSACNDFNDYKTGISAIDHFPEPLPVGGNKAWFLWTLRNNNVNRLVRNRVLPSY